MQGMEVLSNESTPTATAKGSDDYIPSLLEVAKVVNIEMNSKQKRKATPPSHIFARRKLLNPQSPQ